MADSVLSRDEHRDLVRVADLLGVPRGRVVEQLQAFLTSDTAGGIASSSGSSLVQTLETSGPGISRQHPK